MKAFAALKSSDYESLSETVQDFFHFVESFRKLHRLKDLACVGMLKDPIQKLQKSTFGPFQLFFFDNVFDPDEKSQMQKQNKLTKIFEIFSLDQEKTKKDMTMH